MSKENPFFKFDSQAWLSGSIQYCSLEAKGLFADLCAHYWDKQKPLKIDAKFKVRYSEGIATLSDLIGTLSELGLIVNSEAGITIPFLDRLMSDRKEWLKSCSKGGRNKALNQGTSSNKKEERRKKSVDSRKKKEDKKDTYGEFKLVRLTTGEYQTLKDKFTSESQLTEAIQILDSHKEATGKTYKSDRGAMYSWVLNAWSERKQRKNSKTPANILQVDDMKNLDDWNN